VTHRLTLDYGLRYDFQTYLKEQYGRMQDASFSTPNPTVGGLPGAGIYEGYGGGRCNCALSHNYPYAFGPRLGAAFQINSKTVLRAGAGVTYGLVQTPAGASYSTADYYSFNALGYGITPAPNGLAGGNPFPNVTWPNFDPGKYPIATNGLLPPQAPFLFFDPEARPPRILQWSFGLQREVAKDIVVEVTYVGNREVWGAAPAFDQISSNSLNDAILGAHGLSRNNPADLILLTSLIGSPLAASRGFFPAYPGMPLTQTVAQNIRPVPQWTQPSAWLGPPIGKTWYDALQAKATKRFSHGLEMQASFVWSKALVLGTGAETGQFVNGTPMIVDIYNYEVNKQLNQLDRPLMAVISGSYVTPKFQADRTGMKVLSQVLRDWQIGAVLRYQSGALIRSPPSNNQTHGATSASKPGLPEERSDILELRSRREPAGRRPELWMLQSPDGPGSESEGLDRYTGRTIRGLCAVLQQQSLAAAACRGHELWPELPHRPGGQIQSVCPRGVPEHLQPALPLDAVGGRRIPGREPDNPHRLIQRRGHERVWLYQHDEFDPPRFRASTAERPDRRASYLLTLNSPEIGARFRA
jgi:hypothetical protein